MFSLLNKRLQTGKHRARMRKFLNSLPQFFRPLWRPFSKASYLIEDGMLSSAIFAAVGHRIAFLVPQPILLRNRSGKD